MKIGVFASFSTPQATPDVIARTGKLVENAGLDSLWMGEHVVLFDEMEFGYPGSRDGKLPIPDGAGMPDTVATFGFLAAATTTLRFGTGITLIPQRNPLYTAKEFATLDWLTGGRIDLGIGVGWCKEEVLGCGYAFSDRGERCDEIVGLIKRLWTEDRVAHEGKHFQLQSCRLDPKPVQKPHVPIIVGGHSTAAMRRTAQMGDGWFGFALNPALTKESLASLDEQLAAANRTRGDCQVIVTPNRIDEDIVRQFKDLGVDRLVPFLGSLADDTLPGWLDQLERFAVIAG